MNETNTPETDAKAITPWTSEEMMATSVPADFARKLERERDEARAKIERLEEMRQDAHEQWKELFNMASFHWDTMPEDSRKKFREEVAATAYREAKATASSNRRIAMG